MKKHDKKRPFQHQGSSASKPQWPGQKHPQNPKQNPGHNQGQNSNQPQWPGKDKC